MFLFLSFFKKVIILIDFFFRYVGVCCGIKVLSVLTFLLDWWLIKRRETSEKKQTALTVGEVVNSIISLDKRKFSIFLRAIDVLSYFCHRHWRWQSQILNRESLSNLPIKEKVPPPLSHQPWSLASYSSIHGSKSDFATFIADGKSN